MKKSFLPLLSSAMCMLLVSCGHQHTFATEWSHDGTNHWHAATCEHKDLKSEEGSHTGGEATSEHGKICTVCGFEYTPKAGQSTPFDRLFSFGGQYSPYSYEEGTTESGFEEAVAKAFGSDEKLRGDIAQAMGSYGFNPNTRKVLHEYQIEFGSEGNPYTRTFEGLEVTTYDVNAKGDEKLCEFTVDPQNPNQYRLIAPVHGESATSYEPLRLIDKNLSLGSEKKMLVTDAGFTCDESTAVFTYKVDIAIDKEHFVASFSMTFDDSKSQDVHITKQPEDLTVKPAEPVRFEIEVDHPELVEEYQWYSGTFDESGKPYSYKPVKGSRAKQRVFEIPGASQKSFRSCYKCLITVNGRRYFSNYATLTVTDEADTTPPFYVLDYPIKPSETLDLADTSYGTGKINLSEDGKVVTFQDVIFNNEKLESCLTNIGFALISWHNAVNEFTFRFVGESVWYNHYWEDDNNQGGFALFCHMAGESVIPTITFEGDPLTIIGGTRAISATANVVIKNKINVCGVNERLTSGLFAYSFDVKENAKVTGSTGGSILYTLGDSENAWGYITIREGATVEAIIEPGKVNAGETILQGIHALRSIKIEKANVSLSITPDYAFFASTKQYLCPVVGIHSTAGSIRVTNSKVDVKIGATNVPEHPGVLVNTVEGIVAIQTAFIDSLVNVTIDSSSFIIVNGIYSVSQTYENSFVNVNVHGFTRVSGIVSPLSSSSSVALKTDNPDYKGYGDEFLNEEDEQGTSAYSTSSDGVDSKITFTNSNVTVLTNADTFDGGTKGEELYIDAGIRAREFVFNLGGLGSIYVKTNRASAFVSTYAHSKTLPDPETYETQFLTFDNADVSTLTPYEVKPTYYNGFDEEQQKYYVLAEAMYANAATGEYLTEVRLFAL
ncbi:MAG: hypothetical protein MJ239_05690 [Bacilli bacterium]|nr:hypothetical protein [Bacilli bacterium]